jgi:uncharacterized membrane protein
MERRTCRLLALAWAVALTLTVSNTGGVADSFDLDVTVPAGWSADLLANGKPVSTVTLPPAVYNSQALTLLVTPNEGATPGDYDVEVSTAAHSNPAIRATTIGVVEVLNRGVQITVLSGPTSVDPRDTAVWQVRVSNTGQLADTFELQAAGLLAAVGTFSTDSVTLSPGQSQTVPFTADGMEWLLPGVYELVVAAQSQANSNIISQDSRTVTVTGYEAVEVAFVPLSQTISETLTATFRLLITNTGSVGTEYQLSAVAPGADSDLSLMAVQLPAHTASGVWVTVIAPGPGSYEITGTAMAAGGGARDSDTTTLVVPDDAGDPPPPDGRIYYLPVMKVP